MDKLTIKVEYTEESLFNGMNVPDRYDFKKSTHRYGQLLKEALKVEYPDAEVSVKWGKRNDETILVPDGYPEPEDEVAEVVAATIREVYIDYKWPVPLHPGEVYLLESPNGVRGATWHKHHKARRLPTSLVLKFDCVYEDFVYVAKWWANSFRRAGTPLEEAYSIKNLLEVFNGRLPTDE